MIDATRQKILARDSCSGGLSGGYDFDMIFLVVISMKVLKLILSEVMLAVGVMALGGDASGRSDGFWMNLINVLFYFG
jgi:hypothetical protein